MTLVIRATLFVVTMANSRLTKSKPKMGINLRRRQRNLHITVTTDNFPTVNHTVMFPASLEQRREICLLRRMAGSESPFMQRPQKVYSTLRVGDSSVGMQREGL